jgi:superoxide dismutase
MSPKKKNISGEIKNLIEKDFKSLDQLRKAS